MAHCIRLRGPWELARGDANRAQPPGRAEKADQPGQAQPTDSAGNGERITLPDDWTSLTARDWESPLRLLRRFGRPTGITETERVELVIVGATRETEVTLNGQPIVGAPRLPPDESTAATREDATSPSEDAFEWRADVTIALEPRNELTLVIRAAFDEVRLEISPR